ncbi:MAG: ABC transporter permease [Clostridia bacterium]|nr:ABC transporter permease [Clostridia bacterium]
MNKQAFAKLKSFRFTRKVFSYPYVLFMLIFIVTPLFLILINAFKVNGEFSLGNFVAFFKDSSSITVLERSILVGLFTTAVCLLIGYPVAYFLTQFSSSKVIALLFIIPMWVNFLIRTLSTKAIFQILDMPLGWSAVLVGMVYNYLPFMILPLHTTLSNIDKSYIEASEDLGANSFVVFLKTILPLSVPGIISGITMVFIPTISTFAITEILSNRRITLFGDTINYMFQSSSTYGIGSVMSLIMLVMVIISNTIISRMNKNNQGGSAVW